MEPTSKQPDFSQSQRPSIAQEPAQRKSVTTSDFAGNFLTPQSTPEARGSGTLPEGRSSSAAVYGEPHANEPRDNTPQSSQHALLKLLNRSASAGQNAKSAESSKEQAPPFAFANFSNTNRSGTGSEGHHPANGTASPMPFFGSGSSRENTPFDSSTSAPKERKPIFTYTNPFDALQASRKATPRSTNQPSQNVDTNNAQKLSEANGDRKRLNEAVPDRIFTRRKLTPKGPLRSSSSAEHTPKREASVDGAGTNLADSGKEVKQPEADVAIKREDTGSNAELDQMTNTLEQTVLQGTDEETMDQDQRKLNQTSGTATDLAKNKNASAPVEIAANKGENNEMDDTESAPRHVPVYNFPLKPFVSVNIAGLPPSNIGLREDGGVMEISRLKKEFDQVDRTLAAATSKYIAYAFVKNGGMRVIRQDDGRDRQIFKHSGDRIFHVTMCSHAPTSPATDEQAVLGAGVSGAVYYTTISKQGDDLFEKDELDTESLIFPPYPLGNDSTSGVLLKTRIRRSSRHPEFFAIGRGRAIHIVWPSTAMCAKYGVSGQARTVDMEKFYKDRPLKIAIGKAGKDFIFSEDDTTIVSLDKVGRINFWDVRNLIDETTATASKVQIEEVKNPMLSLIGSSSAEKLWPTSVLFVDKLKPYTKAKALRYLLVGLKQNHTLQLWDIALGKAVQEIHFPHVDETDGICSVAYHASSSIVVVGNPTRNSIFFLSLSAPRYTIQAMSQASYAERVAAKDPSLAKLDATACFSGVREISFASKGNLRSLDILPVDKSANDMNGATDNEALFELYVVHSKGVTCLSIGKEDLGLGSDGKVLHPIDDAVKNGTIKVSDLRRPLLVTEDTEMTRTTEAPPPAKSSKRKGAKGIPEALTDTPATKNKLVADPSAAPDAPGQDDAKLATQPSQETPSKREKPNARKTKPEANDLPSIPSGDIPLTSTSQTKPSSPFKPADHHAGPTLESKESRTMASSQPDHINQQTNDPGTMTAGLETTASKEMVGHGTRPLESSVAEELHRQLDKLYGRFGEDRRIQDAANSSRQEAMLRLVSSTLSSNVENSLSRIVREQMQQIVLPEITNVTAHAVQSQLGEALAGVLQPLIPQEMAKHLPAAVSTSMQNPTILRNVETNIAQSLTPMLENHFAQLMRATVAPAFQRLAVSAVEKATTEMDSRVDSKVRHYEIDRQNDAARVEMLQASIQQMMEMLSHLSEGQIAFQDKILAHLSDSASQPSSTTVGTFRPGPYNSSQARPVQRSFATPSATKKSAEELEAEEITNLLNGGKFEEASIRWLQSDRSVQLFDEVFVNYTPDYLDHAVSPLVAFSVGITVANSFEHNVHTRLDWIYTSLNTVDIRVSHLVDLFFLLCVPNGFPALLWSAILLDVSMLTGFCIGSRDDGANRARPSPSQFTHF